MSVTHQGEEAMSDLNRREFVATSVAAAMSTMLPASALAMGQPGGQELKVIDAWGHVSLPRFFSADDFIQILDSNHAEAAVVGTAMTCPDLTELSHAIMKYPDRLRPIGLALGKRPEERLSFISAQLEAGFTGIRLPAPLIAKEPAILDLVGKYGRAAYVEGNDGYQVATRVLLNFMDKYPEAVACGTHFAGPTDTAIFGKDDLVRQLFRHPRFFVIFSRQGFQNQEILKPWTFALIEEAGWNKVMYGSEFPVALWRDETFKSTQDWIDTVGLNPTAEERHKFYYQNAHDLFFQKRVPTHQIDAQWERMDMKSVAPVWLFQLQGIESHRGIDLPEDAHRKIMVSYLAAGGDAKAGSYRDFVTNMLINTANKL
jgi:hypothetical protein